MGSEGVFDLEDLASRYDTQVLREYLLEQEGQPRPAVQTEDAADPPALSEVYELRPRCFRRIRLLLAVNFFAYWTAVSHCGYTFYLHVEEFGTKALPPLEVCVLLVFILGTQATLEFAAAVCLTQPLRASEPRSVGFVAWDAMAWVTG
ncbi:unnamed protein product, partial [Polarella glacialis]